MGTRAYTQELRGADECVVCYEAANGRELWLHADRVCFTSPTAGDGPRATPSISGCLVFTLGATGLLNCLDADTGQRHWSIDVIADNQAGNLYHGLSGSPLVVHDLVIVSTGASGHSLVAYDAHTGRRVWQTGSDPAGYGSPQLCVIDGREQAVILNRPGLAAHDPITGELLWTFPWTNNEETNCSQPAPVANDRLLISTGYGKGAALLQVRQQAGGWSAESLWTSRRLKTKFSSAVIRGERAFGLDDGVLACLNLADGSLCWRAGRYGHGQLLLINDALLVQCENGDVALVAADGSKHHELGRFAALSDKTWNYPALAGRLLIVRNDREAMCFELPRTNTNAYVPISTRSLRPICLR
ncbi:MAG TPA: PQQ-binding-like beta-propeller repeat protein [Pirellulales bacterium]|nr:PQQ-binding-like beta-propeller repeat protein [Pirellulales bacterium]